MDPLTGPIPDRDLIHAWGVEEWIDYFDRHDRFKCALLEAMHDQPQTISAIERALVQARAIDERWEAAAERRLGELMGRLEQRDRERPGDAEPWRASLPAAVTGDAEPWKNSDPDAASGDAEPWKNSDPDAAKPWGGAPPATERSHYHPIAVDSSPAYRQARDVLIAFGRQLSERGQRSNPPPLLAYVSALLTRGAFGSCYGAVWAEQGFPHARRARDLLSARRFQVAARLLATNPEYGLIETSHAARCAARALLERATRR